MPSTPINQMLPFPDRYLAQCRVKNNLAESADTHVPPTADEARGLIHYLQTKHVNAVIVGSVGVLHHLKDTPEENAFRPTVDLDLFVRVSDTILRKVGPPSGWRTDTQSIGVVSWISPTGGYVDFLTAGHVFPSGEKVPAHISADPTSDETFPVAHALELFRLKLASMRAKDLTDLLTLAKARRDVPTPAELGHLNDMQRENLDLIRQWFELQSA